MSNELKWVWRAKLGRVIDGDTVDMYLDTGFHTVRLERIRLLGINAPEIEKETKEAGLRSKSFVEGYLDKRGTNGEDLEFPFVVQTYKSDSFGRYLGKVWTIDNYLRGEEDLSTVLKNNGLAVDFVK